MKILKPYRERPREGFGVSEKKLPPGMSENIPWVLHNDWMTSIKYLSHSNSLITTGMDSCLNMLDFEKRQLKWSGKEHANGIYACDYCRCFFSRVLSLRHWINHTRWQGQCLETRLMSRYVLWISKFNPSLFFLLGAPAWWHFWSCAKCCSAHAEMQKLQFHRHLWFGAVHQHLEPIYSKDYGISSWTWSLGDGKPMRGPLWPSFLGIDSY